MPGAFGIDTSNYTTSTAVYRDGRVLQEKRLLPVSGGAVGLRQSDAVFGHVKALGELTESLFLQVPGGFSAVGVSDRPRNVEGSYMPCFLAGAAAARTLAAACGKPLYRFSHQEGHLAAALFGSGRLDLIGKRFLAFHLSGGTTECLLAEDFPFGRLTLVSATNDLNAGQVIDRVGRLMGLSFPAGRELDALSLRSAKEEFAKPAFRDGNPCLSGLENQCRKKIQSGAAPEDVARYLLLSVLDAVDRMAGKAAAETGCEEIVFAGGVTTNTLLRERLSKTYGASFAPAVFSCDNAAGIAVLAALKNGEAPFKA